MTIIYHYAKDTGEFVGSAEARRDPVAGKALVPAEATIQAPPAAGANQTPVFDGSAWALVADYRGTVYWMADRSRHEIDTLGVEPPAGALFEEPPRTVEELHGAIDEAAGRARNRFVSPGLLIDQEYREAEAAANQWQADGEPSAAVPDEVQAWADAAGMSASAAAADILQTGADWRSVLRQVRRARLEGKSATAAAIASDREAIAQTYIDQLDAMAPQ